MISQPLCSSFGSHQRVPAQRCRAEAGETLGGPASSVTRGSALSTVEAWNHPDLFALLSAGGASSAGELYNLLAEVPDRSRPMGQQHD
jgi:hypothetical protein